MTISLTDKLSLYNGALLSLGERALASLTDELESRRLLDGVWDRGAVDTVLEHGQWNFASRSTKLDYAPSISPAFGYSRAFERPSDFVRVTAVCTDEFFSVPLLTYLDEAGFWFANNDELYVRYVSNDTAYGSNFSLWPSSFKEYVYSWLASKIVWKLTQNATKRDDVYNDMKTLLTAARSNDALNDPTKFSPPGRFVTSRNRRAGSDRGNRSSLLG